MLVEGAARIDDVVVDGDGSIYWCEARPSEGGRCVIVRCDATGARTDVTPRDHNVRTRVHEYGGGAWHVSNGTVIYSNFRDQRLWRIDAFSPDPIALTPEPTDEIADRYADGRFTPEGSWYVCVRERHVPGAEARNELVAVATHGSHVTTLASGADFYAAPRLSLDGSRLAWLQWNHPDMPWDGTELWVASFADGEVNDARRVAGSRDESIVQPEWGPDGSLYFCSDRNDWWNLYRCAAAGDSVAAVVVGEFEIAMPAWGFGQSRYVMLDDGRRAYVRGEPTGDTLVVDGADVTRRAGLTAIGALAARGSDVVFVGASYSSESAVYRVEADDVALVYSSRDLDLDDRYLAAPTSITFASGAATAHALYYAPASATHGGPPAEKPPLIVMAHGGPTGAARTQLNLGLRYWTSRGFAVVDVNYRGSTGYGRRYRHALDHAWGVADVEDCVAVVHHLAAEGLIDGARAAIRGGSAGGFTVLAAAAFHPGEFAAGASHYGIADLEALARDTHKFESRYLDRLVGPYPQDRDVYVARSPIHHLEHLATPLIVLQGLDDEIVPPNQAQMIVDALAARGLTHAYLTFAGEGHGFRQGPNIIRALEAEAFFYSQVFGFALGDPVPPVLIENAHSL
jgi:dipeptidyl aminopeptidase/acylaminoacyl peptidase